MTNEIEMMARKIYSVFYGQIIIDLDLEFCRDLSKRLLTALETHYHLIPKDNVIVLEWDAAPREGDIVHTILHGYSYSNLDIDDKKPVNECEDYYDIFPRCKPEMQFVKGREVQIIQRNGLPVVMKPKPEEVR